MRQICREGGADRRARRLWPVIERCQARQVHSVLCDRIEASRRGGGTARAPCPAPTTYQIKPDVRSQDLIFLILILINERTATQERNEKT